MSIGMGNYNASRTLLNIKAGAGTFTAGTGEVNIEEYSNSSSYSYDKTLQVDSAISFYKLTLAGGHTNSGRAQTYDVVGAVVPTVINTFKWATAHNKSYLNSGTIEVGGDLICDSYDGYGTASIILNGTTYQYITETAGTWPGDELVIDNPYGAVRQTTNIDLSNAAANLTINPNSRWCQHGHDLNVTNTFTNNGILYKHHGGTTTYGSGADGDLRESWCWIPLELFSSTVTVDRSI